MHIPTDGRYETCKVCGLRWNVSRTYRMIDGYICPKCADRIKTIRKKGRVAPVQPTKKK